MHLFLFTLFFGSMYVYFSYISYRNPEGFVVNYNGNDDMVYDDFYTFLLDELFFDKEYYENFCKVILENIGNVYNKHLSIGIKHGGHINEMLRKNMDSITISKSEAITLFCKYNYPSHSFKYEKDYDSDSYIFDENIFTAVSLIDNEVYCKNNIYGLFYNISKWIAHKGYLYIDVYDTVDRLKDGIQTTNSDNFVEKTYRYNNKIVTIDSDRFFLDENIKKENTKRKQTRREFIFHSLDKLEHVAKECGFIKVHHLRHSTEKYSGRGILVLQKQ
jgi:hypothetical protein